MYIQSPTPLEIILTITAIIGNILGWSKAVIKVINWRFNQKKEYYTRGLKSGGYSTQFKCGTYFKLKQRLHLMRDYIDGVVPINAIVTNFGRVYLQYSGTIKIDYNYFDDCANALSENHKLSRKLRKLNALLRVHLSKDGIKNERHTIRELSVECLHIIDNIISKYQLTENEHSCI